MESFYWVRVHLVVLLWLVMFMKSLCYENLGANSSDVYIVTLKQAPAVHYYGDLRSDLTGVRHASSSRLNIHKPRYFFFFFFFLSLLLWCN